MQRPTWQRLEIFECCGQSDKIVPVGNGHIARVEERGARLGEPKLRRSSELGGGGKKTDYLEEGVCRLFVKGLSSVKGRILYTRLPRFSKNNCIIAEID